MGGTSSHVALPTGFSNACLLVASAGFELYDSLQVSTLRRHGAGWLGGEVEP